MFFSQFSQDKFLETNIFKGYKYGFFVDIGAHDGITINNTLFFETERYWTGINIEPIKTVYDKLEINRPNCININCAISNFEGMNDFLYNKGYSEMISGLKTSYDNRHLKRLQTEQKLNGGTTDIISVQTYKLSTILKKYNITEITYLSIDVEGAEYDVIKSIDFNHVHIDVIGFENNYEDTSKQIIGYLTEKGYKKIYDGPDIFMIHNTSKFLN